MRVELRVLEWPEEETGGMQWTCRAARNSFPRLRLLDFSNVHSSPFLQWVSISHYRPSDSFFWNRFCHSEGEIGGQLLAWHLVRFCRLVEVGLSPVSPSHFPMMKGG